MAFVFNIGNTRIQVWREGDEAVAYHETGAIRQSLDLVPIIAQCGDEKIIASCVVPRIRQLLEENWPGRVGFISPASYPFLDFSAYDVATLGADRMANAAMAYKTYGGPVAVIDCGTAINTEVVDVNGRFLGGIIMPGRALSRKALASGTAQLPILKKGGDMPPVLGTNTADAIAAGVDRSCLAGLRQFVVDLRGMPGIENLKVIITGGDAEFFQPWLDDVELAPRFFTLRGIALAREL